MTASSAPSRLEVSVEKYAASFSSDPSSLSAVTVAEKTKVDTGFRVEVFGRNGKGNIVSPESATSRVAKNKNDCSTSTEQHYFSASHK